MNSVTFLRLYQISFKKLTALTNLGFHAKVTIDITLIEKIEEVESTLRQAVPQPDLLL
jgi:hypothetical protein